VAVIPVPTRFAGQFRQLAELPGDDFERLAAAVEASAPSMGPHRLWREVADKAGMDFENVDELLEGVLSAVAIGLRDGLTVVETAGALRIEGFDAQNEDFQARLVRLMSARALTTTLKALDLVRFDQKTLLRGRVVTDIRPVFPGDGALDQPDAAVVKHSLRLEYLEGNQTRTIVVSLDKVDVTRLRDEFDRAQEKAGSLSRLLGTAGVQELMVEPEDEE
jgi:hypothetical protein